MLVAFSVAPSGGTDGSGSVAEAVGAYGSRVSLVLKADVRPGSEGQVEAKVERVDSALADMAEAR